MTICPLWGRLPEIIVTVEDIRVVDGHHFVAANFDGQLLYDSPAQVLNHGPVGIFTVQRGRERPTLRFREQSHRLCQGWGTGQAAAGSGRCC